MKIYCDTDTLPNNITTEHAEQAAVTILAAAHEKGIVVLHGSNISHNEVIKTPNPVRCQQLVDEDEQRKRVQNNERLLGFQAHDRYQTLNPGEDFRPTHCGFSGKVGGGIPGSGFGFGFGFCLGVGGGSGITGAGIGGSGS
jgi:hypothetical protein